MAEPRSSLQHIATEPNHSPQQEATTPDPSLQHGAAESRYCNRRQPDPVFHHRYRIGYIEKHGRRNHIPRSKKNFLQFFETAPAETDPSLQHKVAEPDLSLRFEEAEPCSPSLQHDNTEPNHEVFNISAGSPDVPPKNHLDKSTSCWCARAGYQWDLGDAIQPTPFRRWRIIVLVRLLGEDRRGQCTSTRETFGCLRVLYWDTYIA